MAPSFEVMDVAPREDRLELLLETVTTGYFLLLLSFLVPPNSMTILESRVDGRAPLPEGRRSSKR